MDLNEQLSVILLYTGSDGFPMGDAYTNRVLSIAKGLVEIQCNVKLLIIYPGRKSGVSAKSGTFNSVPYEYLTPLKTSKNIVIKKIIGILGIFKTISKVLFKMQNVDAIISFTESSIYNFPLGYFSRLNGILFLREVNEFPRQVLKRNSRTLKTNERIIAKLALSQIDGLISISYGLHDFFFNELSYKKPVQIIPITVDIDRFPVGKGSGKIINNYITYCGNLFGEKDGVEILLKAFAGIASKHSSYILRLIGDIGNTDEFSKLTALVNKLNLDNQVQFIGYIGREEIPHYLSEAAVLVLARPDNIQSRGGFPTKLGEYLATAKPVLITSVGDIPKYINDGENGFLAEPGSVESFADKLDFILCNYEFADKVGAKGRLLAAEIFNGKKQAQIISEFILKLKLNQN